MHFLQERLNRLTPDELERGAQEFDMIYTDFINNHLNRNNSIRENGIRKVFKKIRYFFSWNRKS
jgi:hypothetical protein